MSGVLLLAYWIQGYVCPLVNPRCSRLLSDLFNINLTFFYAITQKLMVIATLPTCNKVGFCKSTCTRGKVCKQIAGRPPPSCGQSLVRRHVVLWRRLVLLSQ
ncbi:unnamed protein product [Chrysodeixis includens]|uniref:Uncharacterized protein n=1 Tax=Chrysodeixis includens TaxID=689277 RepID=A0A9N8KTC8_CHRIL|nr:unnamed protein product [Chrysodeixis includens]